MKAKEFKPCCCCKKGMAHAGDISFFRIKLTRMALAPGAIQRQHGLEQAMGGGKDGAALASILGPNEDLATAVGNEVEVLLCQSCWLNPNLWVAEFIERAIDSEEGKPDGPAAG